MNNMFVICSFCGSYRSMNVPGAVCALQFNMKRSRTGFILFSSVI